MSPIASLTIDIYKDSVDVRLDQRKDNLTDKERRRLEQIKKAAIKAIKEQAVQLELS